MSFEWDEPIMTDYEDYEEDEEYEVEELVDDQPMRMDDRLFIGSVDAARNAAALRNARIGFVMALLGATDAPEQQQPQPDGIETVTVRMEDSLDEDLFSRLPELLHTLGQLIERATASDQNVLVHCLAGRSRSAALIAAWLFTQSLMSVDEAIERMREIRPWIDINPRFLQDLRQFHLVAYEPGNGEDRAQWSQELREVMATHQLPCVDFGASLVGDILDGTKRVTMRLLSDATNDLNSDLKSLYEFSLVVATTENQALGPDQDPKSRSSRKPFALLQIVDVEASKCVCDLPEEAIRFSTGLTTQAELLALLQQYYPHVTAETPLMMVHFDCLMSVQKPHGIHECILNSS